MTRTDIINFYINRIANYVKGSTNSYVPKYLEIGVGSLSANFNKINTSDKDGVDPKNPCNHRMDSDRTLM